MTHIVYVLWLLSASPMDQPKIITSFPIPEACQAASRDMPRSVCKAEEVATN